MSVEVMIQTLLPWSCAPALYCPKPNVFVNKFCEKLVLVASELFTGTWVSSFFALIDDVEE